MDRSDILTAMGTLKLHGMKVAYDEIIATAVKRQHEPQSVIGGVGEGTANPHHGDLHRALMMRISRYGSVTRPTKSTASV